MGREGSGVTIKNGRYQLSFEWQGVRRRPSLSLKISDRNYLSAVRMLETIKSEIRNGTFDMKEHFDSYAEKATGVVNKTMFDAYVDAWLISPHVTRDRKKSTLQGYKYTLYQYWIPAFKGRHLRSIKRREILDVLKTITGSNKSYNNAIVPLRCIFNEALQDELITEHPMLAIKSLKLQASEIDPFEAEEVELVLTWMRKKLSPEVVDFFEFAFFTGLRASEQVDLRWNDVSLALRSIRVSHAKVHGMEQDETKTKSARTVLLGPRAMAVLTRQRARTQMADNHVFCKTGTTECWAAVDSVSNLWRDNFRGCPVRYRSMSQTRHTRATMLIMMGKPEKWVALQMGHSTQTLNKHYARWLATTADQMMADTGEWGNGTGMTPSAIVSV